MIFHVYEGIPEINETATTYGDIQRAYNRMSNLYNCGELDFPAKIIIHKGIYPITRPLHFNNKFPVSIEAFEDERPIISGATQITDWQPCQINGVSAFRTVLPAEVKELPFFYVNGKMAQPARYPKKDLLRVTDI